MNASYPAPTRWIAAALYAVVLTACAAAPAPPPGADDARARLTELQSDRQLASRAPVAIGEAELAVKAAEQPIEDLELAEHLVFMADRKVAIAWAEAQQRLAVDQREEIAGERDRVRLAARTSEADVARSEADLARAEADAARSDMAAARNATEAAEQNTDDLRAEIAALNAKTTERGLLMTLGDVLFDVGQADLRVGQNNNLEKLTSFLIRYGDRQVVIEGHTDDQGSADANYGLSQRRAEAVKAYLVRHGVSSDRLSASGKGESYPIAANDTAWGRQQNRRVEVIISDAAVSSR